MLQLHLTQAHEGILAIMPAAQARVLRQLHLLLFQLMAEVDGATLAKLREAVDNIKEPFFQYDKSYVYDCMEWGSPESTPAAPGGR